MTLKEKLRQIAELARGANLKKVSELTELEAHAVAFCSELFPAIRKIDGTPKYNKEGEEVTYAAAYVAFRRIKDTIDPTLKGFAADSFHIYPDEDLPSFKEHNVKSALECYPNILYIPPKKCEHNHLPRMQKQEAAFPSEDEVRMGIASTIAQVNLYVIKDVPASKPILAAHKMILAHWGQFLKIAGNVGLAHVVTAIEDSESDYQIRGTVDFDALNSPHSYLGTFLYMASKGVILKVKHDV